MPSAEDFFLAFQNSVLGANLPAEENDSNSLRVPFFMYQFSMVPAHLEEMFCNMLRTYPTSPIFAFLGLGFIGTNISRTCAIRRIGSHFSQSERAGTFLNFLGPSRVGKGIALKLVSDIGMHVQEIRSAYYIANHLTNRPIDANGNRASISKHAANCERMFPRSVFLTGANGLQTQATAAQNGGSGIIFVPEIKSGKGRYTDLDGSYGPLLSFHDTYIPERTYRKAQNIPCIPNCHIQMLAAGVNED